MFNFTMFMKMLQLAPLIVAGVEQIHAEAPSATKKQLAIDSLMLATGTADALDPALKPVIDGVSQTVGNVIDSIVTMFNTIGVFKHSKPAASPAPGPTAQSVIS